MNQWTRNGENMKTHRMIRGRRAGGLSGQSASINGGGVAFSRRCFVRESDRATKLGHQKNLIVRGRESLRRKLIELIVRGRESLRRKLIELIVRGRESLRRKLIELIVRGRESLRRKLSRVLIYLRERERERRTCV
jgi:hypothetical protein